MDDQEIGSATTYADPVPHGELTMAKLDELFQSIKTKKVLTEIRVSTAGRKRIDEVFPVKQNPDQPAAVYGLWGVPVYIDNENIDKNSTIATLRYSDGSETLIKL